MEQVLVILIGTIGTLITFTSAVSVAVFESSCGTSGVLSGAVLGVVTDVTDLRCSRLCKDNLQCQSVEYQPETATSVSACSLLDGDVTCNGAYSSGISHYQLFARIPSGWSYFSGSIYTVTLSIHTYQECADLCGDLDANLTSITNAEEDEFVLTHLNLDRNLWLSGNDLAVEGRWVWGNGDEFGYTNWAGSGSQPDNGVGIMGGSENCLMIKPSSGYPHWKGWNDDNCGFQFHCVCETRV